MKQVCYPFNTPIETILEAYEKSGYAYRIDGDNRVAVVTSYRADEDV